MSGFGAVLRVSGSKKGVEKFLACTSWVPLSVFWKGEKRSEHSRSIPKINGFNANVSNAAGRDLAKQVKDAIRMLRRDGTEFRRLRRLGLHGVLDFGVEVSDKDGPAFFRFPTQLVQLLATYGLDMEVSYYGAEP